MANATGHGEGWKRVLGWLETFVERAETSGEGEVRARLADPASAIALLMPSLQNEIRAQPISARIRHFESSREIQGNLVRLLTFFE